MRLSEQKKKKLDLINYECKNNIKQVEKNNNK